MKFEKKKKDQTKTSPFELKFLLIILLFMGHLQYSKQHNWLGIFHGTEFLQKEWRVSVELIKISDYAIVFKIIAVCLKKKVSKTQYPYNSF